MRNRDLFGAVLLAAASWAGFARAPAQEGAGATAKAPVTATCEDLVWLSGSWQQGSGDDVIEEHWTLPAGGSLIGMSRTVKRGQTAFFEYPAHDFPNRIVYERIDDELHAAVSGPVTANETEQRFRYVRAGDGVRLPD